MDLFSQFSDIDYHSIRAQTPVDAAAKPKEPKKRAKFMEAMGLVATRRVYQVGTFNGNALAMAVARDNLQRVLTPVAHQGLEELASSLASGCSDALGRAGRSGHGAFAGARGFVALTSAPAHDHTGVGSAHPPELSRLAWLYLMNRGLFVTPARPLQWMVGLGHTEDDVAGYVSAFEELVTELA